MRKQSQTDEEWPQVTHFSRNSIDLVSVCISASASKHFWHNFIIRYITWTFRLNWNQWLKMLARLDGLKFPHFYMHFACLKSFALKKSGWRKVECPRTVQCLPTIESDDAWKDILMVRGVERERDYILICDAFFMCFSSSWVVCIV